MTTFAEVVQKLGALTVTGVKRVFTAGPPSQLNAAALPAQWCDMPQGNERPACAGKGGQDRTINIDLVIALQAVGQDLRLINWPAAVEMMDNVAAALRAWDETGGASPFLGPISWQSRLTVVEIGGIGYWAVVTEISGLG